MNIRHTKFENHTCLIYSCWITCLWSLYTVASVKILSISWTRFGYFIQLWSIIRRQAECKKITRNSDNSYLKYKHILLHTVQQWGPSFIFGKIGSRKTTHSVYYYLKYFKQNVNHNFLKMASFKLLHNFS